MWYHFTDKANLVGILRDGLCPRGVRESNFSGVARDGLSLESNPACVYLTSRKCRPWHCFDYDNSCMLVIDDSYLDDRLKRADEDEARFGTAGTVAYEGGIPSDAIEEVWFWEPRKDANGDTRYVMVEQDFRDW